MEVRRFTATVRTMRTKLRLGGTHGLLPFGAIASAFAIAGLLRWLPWFELVEQLLIYLLAVAVAALTATRFYGALRYLHGTAFGRWLARCAAGAAAMAGFVALFIASGHGSAFDRSGKPLALQEGLVLGVAMGVLYATVIALAQEFPRPGRRSLSGRTSSSRSRRKAPSP